MNFKGEFVEHYAKFSRIANCRNQVLSVIKRAEQCNCYVENYEVSYGTPFNHGNSNNIEYWLDCPICGRVKGCAKLVSCRPDICKYLLACISDTAYEIIALVSNETYLLYENGVLQGKVIKQKAMHTHVSGFRRLFAFLDYRVPQVWHTYDFNGNLFGKVEINKWVGKSSFALFSSPQLGIRRIALSKAAAISVYDACDYVNVLPVPSASCKLIKLLQCISLLFRMSISSLDFSSS